MRGGTDGRTPSVLCSLCSKLGVTAKALGGTTGGLRVHEGRKPHQNRAAVPGGGKRPSPSAKVYCQEAGCVF